MASKSVFDTISIDDIDLSDLRFKISTSEPSGTLVDTIAHVGVITPPVLLKQGKSYVIVSGFRRIIACKRLGIHRVVVQIHKPDTPHEHCVRIAIVENTRIGALNVVEQSRIIQLLDQLYSDQDEVCQEANRLGFSINLEMVEKLRRVSKMSSVLQKALIKGHMALPVALQLKESFDETAANKIATLFGKIVLSLNRQREFIDCLIGISFREKISFKDLLEDPMLNNFVNDSDADRKQKSHQVRDYLKKRRYPEISKAEQRYHAFIKALRLGKGMQIIPPPHFEGTTYAIKIEFRSHEELLRRYRNLEDLLTSSTLKSFMENFIPNPR
jgi:hypothetical protein